jgi:hypothetical protein
MIVTLGHRQFADVQNQHRGNVQGLERRTEFRELMNLSLQKILQHEN